MSDKTDLIVRIVTAAIKLGVQFISAGRHRDAEALLTQLEALAVPIKRADVATIESEAAERLRAQRESNRAVTDSIARSRLGLGDLPPESD